MVVEWNLETKGDGKLLVKVNRPVYSMLMDTHKQQLYCGTASGNLHIIDWVAGKEIRNIEAHTLGIFDIKQINNRFVTAGGDGCIRVWDEDFNLLNTLAVSDKSARVIAVHPSLSQFAVGFSDFHIRIFDAQTLSCLHEWEAHSNSVFALAYHPSGQLLYSGGRDVMLRSWELNQPTAPLLDIPAHTLHINAIAFSPDETLFATVSMDKTLKLWDSPSGQLLKVIDKLKHDGHVTSVNKVMWLNDTELITCSDDRTVMVWKIER